MRKMSSRSECSYGKLSRYGFIKYQVPMQQMGPFCYRLNSSLALVGMVIKLSGQGRAYESSMWAWTIQDCKKQLYPYIALSKWSIFSLAKTVRMSIFLERGCLIFFFWRRPFNLSSPREGPAVFFSGFPPFPQMRILTVVPWFLFWPAICWVLTLPWCIISDWRIPVWRRGS